MSLGAEGIHTQEKGVSTTMKDVKSIGIFGGILKVFQVMPLICMIGQTELFGRSDPKSTIGPFSCPPQLTPP